MIVTALAIAALIMILVTIYNKVYVPSVKYDKAMAYIEEKNYDDAYALLKELGRDDEINENKYSRAEQLYKESKYIEAYELFNEISYEDSEKRADESLSVLVKDYVAKGMKSDAFEIFLKIKQKDLCSIDYATFVMEYADEYINEGKIYEGIEIVEKANINSDESNQYLDNAYLKLAQEKYKNKEYSAALALYKNSPLYTEKSDFSLKCLYAIAKDKFKNGDYEGAKNDFQSISTYSNSKDMMYKSMYNYILNNKSKSNTKSVQYLNTLISIDYPGIDELYNEFYQRNVTLKVDNYSNYARITIKAEGGNGSDKFKFRLMRERRCDGNGSGYCDIELEECYMDEELTLSNGEIYETNWSNNGASDTIDYYILDSSRKVVAEQICYYKH